MKRLLFGALALVVLMFACKGKQAEGVVEGAPQDTTRLAAQDTMTTDTLEQLIAQTPMPRAADELFDDFLFNFAANQRLQMERVAFPLRVVRNGDTIWVGKDKWKRERFFMNQDFYTVIFDNEKQMELVKDTSVSEAIVEKVYFNTGAVLKYQFKRLRGAWMLLEQKTEPIKSNNNASFLEFYHKFVTDSVFQAQSLDETVTFVGPDPDDDFAQMEGIVTLDTWPAFAPELPDRMIYNIVYGKPMRHSEHKIFVMRGIANGMELEMTFHLNDGQWRLMKIVN